MDFKRQVKIIRSSRESHLEWYKATYPDVGLLNMDPAEHYLRFGASMGRNPGKAFDTDFYLDTYPDVARSGLNPLVHYALFGHAEGRAKTPRSGRQRTDGQIARLKNKLRSFGFVDAALADLHALAAQSPNAELAALAAREIALAAYREKTPEGFETCLDFLARARDGAPDALDPAKTAAIEALCLHRLGRLREGRDHVRAACAGEAPRPDLHLAEANFAESEAERIACINRALAGHAIPALTAQPGDGPLYDRLAPAAVPPATAGGPKVSVLVAAHDAEATLPTTLRALQAQTWTNLEILVIDDASLDATRAVAEDFARADPRIRVETMPENAGAYVARNRGLDRATGEIVTLNDADDWSHPVKIETQLRHLLADERLVACASQQARATDDMGFGRLNGLGNLTYLNTSSIMVRREPFRRLLGYWDTVRFAADTEMLKRLTAAAGETALSKMATGPLSFQRVSDTSATADLHFGIEGFHYGARLAYLDAYRLHHAKARSLVYTGDSADRPFPVPYPMRPDREKDAPRRHFDVIVASDFRMAGGSTRSSIEEVICQTRAGVSTAVMQMYRYDLESQRSPLSFFEELMDFRELEVLAYGERVSCDLLILRYPPVLQHRQRYLPDIAAGEVRVIVNQPPMSDYSGRGEQRYTLARAAENLRHYFGRDATWHPIGPLVRRALHDRHADELHHIHLAERDWHNVIDVAGWQRGPRRRGPSDRLRIGRHSRDEAVKWPDTRETLLAAYPAVEDVEIHVLGGAETPAAVLGGLPANWVVTPFGKQHPRDFLAEIDVFVYFTAPGWVESFGRTILEAMAVGVPAILPEDYRVLFGDAALYATPDTAVEVARAIHADPAAYAARVECARAFVAAEFSYETHLDRIATVKEAMAAE